MHHSSVLRMKWFLNNFLDQDEHYRILDVGSYGGNLCTYKDVFKDCNFTNISYTGLDTNEGPNVDFIPKNIYSWSELDDDTFDVIISGQAFEHIEFFWLTMEEMTRVLKKDGLLCIIAPHGFAEHRYPVDCWRFFSDGMVALARWTGLKVIHAHTNAGPSKNEHDWFSRDCADSILIAKKTYSGAARRFNPEGYVCVPMTTDDKSQNMILASEYYSDLAVKSREARKKFKSYLNRVARLSKELSTRLLKGV